MTAQQNYRVDSFVGGLAIKAPVKVATAANITLSGEQTVNTVALLEGDRCLVKDQTAPAENGIYTVEQSSWARAGDFDGKRDVVKGTLCIVELPSGEFEIYQVTSATPTIGTDAITIELFLSSTALQDLQAATDLGAITTNDIELPQIVLNEAAAAGADVAGKGRIWLKNTDPVTLWWTNELGADIQLGLGGTGGINNVVEDATPELGGDLACVDQEVQRAELIDYSITSTSPASTTGAVEFDCALGNTFEHELDEDITGITLSNPPPTGKYGEMTIKFKQDVTGSWTVTGWPASVKWAGGAAPTITVTATTGVDLVHLCTWDAGATWYATVAQDFS